MQLLQAELPSEIKPATQEVHAVTPATLYFPVPQDEHAVAEVARLANLPASHKTQPVAPAAPEYLPASHTAQIEDAGTEV